MVETPTILDLNVRKTLPTRMFFHLHRWKTFTGVGLSGEQCEERRTKKRRVIGKVNFYFNRGRDFSSKACGSRIRKRPYDIVKIENQSCKRSHRLDGIGVGRIRTFPFLPIPFTTPLLMIQWKLGCRSRKQKRKNQPIARPGPDDAVFRWS